MAKAITPKGMHPPIGMYTHGMAAVGEVVVVAGQVGIDPTGKLAGPDVESQTRQALENIGHVLKAAGCRWSDVVRMQTFLTGP
ncbi:MAG: RidA family protein, partial [Alphaproteobacteria bacterium]|nr:RidA family protein [Alphaproteobacteria bacterium]